LRPPLDHATDIVAEWSLSVNLGCNRLQRVANRRPPKGADTRSTARVPWK
jgi:hypothetical protein